MYSLFKVKFNWALFFGIAIFIRIVFTEMNWLSYIAILIFLHQFILLFYSINYVIPIRYIFGAFMCLQMLLGPALAYNGLDKFQYFLYKMQVPEDQYFSYALPAVITFILGLHLGAGKLKGEVLDQKSLQQYVDRNIRLAYIFVGIGFVASFFAEYFSAGLSFVFVLLANLKYIGAFIIILSNTKLKLLPLLIVLGSVVLSSLGNGMFHDLLTWLIMGGAVFAIKKRPSVQLKLMVCAGFILLTISIQLIKVSYRTAIGKNKQEAGISTLTEAFEDQKRESNQFFDLNELAWSNVRINQGYIITHVMQTVPNRVPFAKGGELYKILESAFLPRVLAPDKLDAGEKVLFNKYSGMHLNKNTSMGLSSLGDGYINYGVFGGCAFMFALGFFYNIILKNFQKYSKYYPVLILFTPFVFIYSIRPDCELQTSLGFVVKSIFVIIIIFQFWKSSFKVYPKTI